MKSIVTSLTLAFLLSQSPAGAKEFNLDWTEIQQFENEPEWFKDSKLGIYFHWGVYSVPATSVSGTRVGCTTRDSRFQAPC